MKKNLLIAALAVFGCASAFAQEAGESVTERLVPTADTYLRMNNTGDNGGKSTMEIWTATYNPQIQIFAEFETKRPFFESSFKTKRPKKDLHATRTTKPEIRAKITLFRAWALSSTIQQAI